MMKKVLAMLILVGMVSAADAPKFSELANLKIVAAYQRALLDQQQAAAAQQSLQNSVNAFNAMCEQEVKAAGMPKGTQCQVDAASQKATAVLPSEKKAEEPKK